MENCGYSSPRNVAFPAGLRVLVVDDDPTWLKILEKMLIKCLYEVTTCGLAIDALSLLRERKDGFDIVISDVNMPDMDGFKLLEHVGLEMDLPVIMMSVDGETSRVMKGVQHGACDYLLKPIRMKELRNIWQHVFRKRIHEIKDIENHDGGGHMEDRYFSCGGTDLTSVKKRKDLENGECNDYLSLKKTRVIWTVDLHQKFVKAVNLVGLDKVGPKKILDLMNIPRLTRENVASHLQKYRLYLSRLQKEKELNTSFSRMKHRDFFFPKEHIVNQNLQNLTTMQQDDSKNSSTMHNADFEFLEGKAIEEPKRENLDPRENSSSRMRFKNPFAPFDSESNQHFLQNSRPGFNLVNVKSECLQPVPDRELTGTLWNIKGLRHDQIPMLDLSSEQQISNLSRMNDFTSWCENQRVCSFDGDLRSLESLGSTGDSEDVAEAPVWLYDSLRFDCEYPSDNGLFII